MTIDDWWIEIEQHMLNRNWSGVLICADGLQESGDERLAGCLRWISRLQIEVQRPCSDYYKASTYATLFISSTLPKLIDEIQKGREHWQ